MRRHCGPGPAGKCSFSGIRPGTFSLVRLLGPPWFGLPTLQIQRSYALENLNVTIVNALFYCGSYFLRDYYSIY